MNYVNLIAIMGIIMISIIFYKYDHFTTIKMICSKDLDKLPRYSVMNDSGGIYYTTNEKPYNAYPVKCHPFDFISNYCYKLL
jgi:hypothetical protein